MLGATLNNHPFLNHLGQIAGKIIADTTEQNDSSLVPLRKYEPHEEYLTEVLLAAGEVDTILTQIDHSILFMSNFRSTPKLKENEIGRFNHIVYHIENYLIRLTGCFDRALILVNVALDLGNSPQDCSYWLLKKNKHVKDSGVLGPLGEMNGIVKPFKAHRNVVAHRKRFSEPSLRELELLHLVRNSDQTSSEQLERWDYIAKLKADQLVAKRKDEMKDITNKLGAAVGRLFDALHTGVEQHYEQLKAAV